MQDLITIPFAGGAIEATLGPDGRHYINIRRVCDELGIKYSSQLRKLQAKPWATVLKMRTVANDGKEREMLFVDTRALAMWAATIADNKIKAELRPRLRAYQVEAAAVLADHFLVRTHEVPTITGEPGTAMAILGNVRALVATNLEAIQGLTTVAVDHEYRLRAIEAKPAVSVIVKTKKGQAKRLLTRWIARFREETSPITEAMTQSEKADYYRAVHSHLKAVWGDKKNWTDPEKFYEAARWLLKNYGLDITDIEEPT